MLHAAQGEPRYRVDMTVEGHAVVADELPEHGGGGAGPSPFAHVLSGLAACTLITLRMYAERKGWAGFHIEGQFRHRTEEDRHRIDRHLQVTGVPDEAGLERLRDIVERTPVTLALKAGFGIATSLSEQAAQEAKA